MQTVAILLEDLVEDAEFIYPFYRLQEAGYAVEVLAPRPGEYKGKRGGAFRAEHAADPGRAGEYAALFIPGGYAPDRLRRSDKVLDLVRSIYADGKPVAAICHGPWVLVSAGIANGKKMTGFHSIRDDLVNAGARYTGERVERDGNLLTATDPSALPKMLPLLLEMLEQQHV